MTKTLAPALAGLILSAMPASAALSGYYDSAEQIGAILSSSQVADALAQMPVEKLEHERTTSDGMQEWAVESRDCDLSVFLRAVPPAGGAAGKTTYEVASITRCD